MNSCDAKVRVIVTRKQSREPDERTNETIFLCQNILGELNEADIFFIKCISSKEEMSPWEKKETLRYLKSVKNENIETMQNLIPGERAVFRK